MILALLKLMRLYYALPLAGGFIVILSYLTGGNIDHIPEKAVLAFLSTTLHNSNSSMASRNGA